MNKKTAHSLKARLAPLEQGKVEAPSGYKPQHEGHGHSATTVRRATHRGREIEIDTTYEIRIDGKPFGGHVIVLEDGTVHYHGLPNYSFPSVVELARRIVDREARTRPKDELNPPGSERKRHK